MLNKHGILFNDIVYYRKILYHNTYQCLQYFNIARGSIKNGPYTEYNIELDK